MFSRAAASHSKSAATRRMTPQALQPWKTRQRHQSTSSGQAGGTSASHLAAGVAGGSVVAVIGYAYYHKSGLKAAVQTSQQVTNYIQTTRDTVVQKARETAKNPNQALESLRSVARSYASFVPGASGYIDATFDQLEELRETHGEEMDAIMKQVTDDMARVASEGKADAATAAKVYEVLSKGIERLRELGKKVGEDVLEKNPQLKEKLGSGYEKLKELAEKGGPEAMKVYEEVKNQLKDLAKGGSLNEERIQHAQKMIRDKTTQLQELAKSSGAGAYLQSGSENLKKVIGSLPMGDEILEKVPHLQDIMDLADKRGKEAKELLEETYRDVTKVLEEKGKKAKDLGEKARDDTKQRKN